MGIYSGFIVFRKRDDRKAGSLETERIAAGSGKEGDGLSLVLLLLVFLRCHSDNCSYRDCSCQILDFLCDGHILRVPHRPTIVFACAHILVGLRRPTIVLPHGRILVGPHRPTIVIKVILSGPSYHRVSVHCIRVTAADDQVIDLGER